MRKKIIACIIPALLCTVCACSENKQSDNSETVRSSSAQASATIETDESNETGFLINGSDTESMNKQDIISNKQDIISASDDKLLLKDTEQSDNQTIEASLKDSNEKNSKGTNESSKNEASVINKKEKPAPAPERKTDISECCIDVESFPADGSTALPTVKISYKKQPLKEDVDYTITHFSPSSEMGEYELLISMTGRFEGEQRVSYRVTPLPTEIKSFSAKISKLSVFWSPVNGIDGYEIQHADNPDFKDAITLIKKPDEASLSLSGLPENTVRYFRIRTFKAVNGKDIYSSYSKTLKAPVIRVEKINGATYIDGILIANKTYALPESFGTGEDQEALNAFYRMQKDASSQGLSISIISGFRSYYTQLYTYQYFVDDRGREAADRVSARPGHSEHQTGLAFDINSTSFAFTETPEAKWLAENCAEYGFIIRYPEGKEDVTGYSYESWHIRYLGVEKAKLISESGLTLEEYYGFSSRYKE